MKSVRVTFDLALTDHRIPARGDILHTPHRCYRILEARPVDSKVWGNRWRLQLTRIDPSEADPVAQSWRSRRYVVGESPQSHFGEAA